MIELYISCHERFQLSSGAIVPTGHHKVSLRNSDIVWIELRDRSVAVDNLDWHFNHTITGRLGLIHSRRVED